ncbi:MAG: iron-sulfur cluster assembly accessory protein [Verrucomicrobiota bacterium]|jgi:iron-sulfur cluster assembly protein
MITLTENAAKQIGALQKEHAATDKPLRVYAQEGGCCGVQFGMGFDAKQAEDTVVSQAGIEVVIDPQSAPLLAGSVVDYVVTPEGEGFKIENPNNPKKKEGGCDCGHGSCH